MNRSFQVLCAVCLLILPLINHAQIWVARYNGPANDDDWAFAIAVDDAGNVYVTGRSANYWDNDYVTVKYDASGVEQWVVRYNGPGYDNDHAWAIALDSAGNVYVTGSSHGSGTSIDYATVKYDTSGVEQWVARYNGPDNSHDGATAIALDGADNIYVTGTSYGSSTSWDYATVKYDNLGVEQWVARYNTNLIDEARAMALDDAGNVYITGYSWDLDNLPIYVTVKYDTSGVEQWVVLYNGPSNGENAAGAIAVDDADNVYVTGHSMGLGTGIDYATVKYDTSGVEQWVARYNSPGNYDDFACAIALDGANNIYVTGTSYGSDTSGDYVTVKYDTSGVEQWVAQYNGPGNDEDCAIAIAVDYMGNVHVTGQSMGLGTGNDYATVKYDNLGVEQWVKRYNGPANQNDLVRAIALDDVSNVYVTGGSRDLGTGLDYTTIKYPSTGINEDVVTQVRVINYGTSIISGPLLLPSDKKCKVFDITGRFVEPTKINRGIYFIEIDGEVTQKVVKVR